MEPSFATTDRLGTDAALKSSTKFMFEWLRIDGQDK